jgi:hypothetical protein
MKQENIENQLEKYEKDIKNEIYPFINEMVDTFYTENCNELIENSISGGYDKSIFLMFVVMYFGIHLKLENSNKEEKKTQIKLLMTDFIKDPIKRNMCINIFEEKFHNSFLEQKKINNKKDTK